MLKLCVMMLMNITLIKKKGTDSNNDSQTVLQDSCFSLQRGPYRTLWVVCNVFMKCNVVCLEK